MKSRHTVLAFATGLAALALAACSPAGVQDAGHTTATAGAVTSDASPEASASISPPPTTPADATPSAPASTSPASVPVTTHAKQPAPRRTTPPVHHTSAPPVHHTSAPPVHHTTAPPRSAECSIRSNAGNCYRAGQFCRKADLGRTTTDAEGRSITCKMVSGKPHWHY